MTLYESNYGNKNKAQKVSRTYKNLVNACVNKTSNKSARRYVKSDTICNNSGQQGYVVVKILHSNYNKLPAAALTPTLTVSTKSLSLTAGGSGQISYSATPSVARVNFTSSSKSVATVDSSGKVTALKAGTAIIWIVAAYNDDYVMGSCDVTVKAAETVDDGSDDSDFIIEDITDIPERVSLNVSTLSIDVGKTGTLTSKIRHDESVLSWTSSNTSVATVSGSGKNGIVTGKAAGTATITVTATYKNAVTSASATVTVKKTTNTYTGYITGTNGSLAINSTTSSASKYQIGSIPECAPCTVNADKTSGNWVWVTYGSTSGWSYKTYITTTAPTAKTGTIKGTSGSLAINSKASAGYQIGKIPEGKTCIVYTNSKKNTGNWVWVSYNGVYGYAYKTYIKY